MPEGSASQPILKRRKEITKDVTVRMRVTEEQKRLFVETAEREGLEMSAWLRQIALRAAKDARIRSQL